MQTTQIVDDTSRTGTPTATTEAEFQAGRVLTMSAAHGVHDTYTAFLPSLLPVFIANLALSKTEAGLSVGPVLMALVQESLPENRALANGVYMALSFIIRSAVIVVLGAIGDLFSLRTAFGASAVITVAGLPLIPLLARTRHAAT